MMEINKLKQIGKEIETPKMRSNIKPLVLSILKQNKKDGIALTQKEIADKLSSKLDRTIRPQHARSVLLSLRKENKIVRRVISPPDENGNTHFWYIK